MTSEHMCNLCEIGSYDGMIELVAPSWSSKKTICVDICLAMEITNLWKAGIRTTGCCCGHGKALGYIGVWEEDIQRMIDIGYVVRPNETDGSRRDGFYPKTEFSTRAVPDVPELVRYGMCYDKLEDEWSIDPKVNGQYVLHSQAAEIIAADRAEIERLRSLNHYAALEAQAIKRAEAAEAKLAQIKAQSVNHYKCEGCDRVTNDPQEDMRKLKLAGHLSCCPERKILPYYAAPVSDSPLAPEKDN